MDHIKEAFQKVKQDIDILKLSLKELREEMIKLKEEIKNFQENIQKFSNFMQNSIPAHSSNIPTNQHIIPTHPAQIQHINSLLNPLKNENQVFSTGNEGVPTDRQTNQQTDRHINNSMENTLEILNSLDNFKKDIRLKFKRLTEQEMAVFSEVYQFDEEIGFSDYKSLSQKLNLTESSIRDYIGKLIKKGIPVEKTKINNKNIQISVSKNLKNIIPLSTILALRDL